VDPGGVSGGGPGGGSGGSTEQVPASGTQVQLRLLTRSEYHRTVSALFGGTFAQQDLPEDYSVAGFDSVGAALTSLKSKSLEQYESAAQAIAAEVFSDNARRLAHVGCEPMASLTDACTSDYLTRFGRLAFRRALSPAEVTKWTGLAAKLAALSSDPVESLSQTTATMLQAPDFLYRVETAVGDGMSPRYKFDAYSVATRLAFLLTGQGPNDALLTAAEQGALNTPAGVLAAANTLLAPGVADDHLGEYFIEFAGLTRLAVVGKSPEFASFDAALRADLLEETRLWIQDVVLGPGADAMSFLDSPRGYINPSLAQHYGVPAAGAGFQPYEFAPETGRAGIFGKGSFLAMHSGANTSHPTRRGVFILKNILCTPVPPVPTNVDTSFKQKDDPNTPRTTRQKFEAHQADKLCASCHSFMDPYGFALEHFDPIGRYRTEERNLPVSAQTTISGTPVNGAVEMAAVLRKAPESRHCFATKFYRYANAAAEAHEDDDSLMQVADAYENRPFLWREFLGSFVSSDLFLSTQTDSRDEANPEESAEEPGNPNGL
jgi:hypothetical protein